MNSNNKGQGLALSTIIILIIGLVALVVIVSFFTGTTGKIFGPLSEVTSGTTEELPGRCVSNQDTSTICEDFDNKEDCESQDNDPVDDINDCKWTYL